MAHYAFIDENNIVVQVIVGRNEDETIDGISDWETYYGELEGFVCKRTSYNTYGNKHNAGGVPFRGNYAGIGHTYDEIRDAFIPPEPPDAIGFDEDTLTWIVPPPVTDVVEAPVAEV